MGQFRHKNLVFHRQIPLFANFTPFWGLRAVCHSNLYLFEGSEGSLNGLLIPESMHEYLLELNPLSFQVRANMIENYKQTAKELGHVIKFQMPKENTVDKVKLEAYNLPQVLDAYVKPPRYIKFLNMRNSQ